MKKPNRAKLILRQETVRALASVELTQAVGGGGAAVLGETGKEMCTTGVATNKTISPGG